MVHLWKRSALCRKCDNISTFVIDNHYVNTVCTDNYKLGTNHSSNNRRHAKHQLQNIDFFLIISLSFRCFNILLIIIIKSFSHLNTRTINLFFQRSITIKMRTMKYAWHSRTTLSWPFLVKTPSVNRIEILLVHHSIVIKQRQVSQLVELHRRVLCSRFKSIEVILWMLIIFSFLFYCFSLLLFNIFVN